jgi:hypothetical protein
LVYIWEKYLATKNKSSLELSAEWDVQKLYENSKKIYTLLTHCDEILNYTREELYPPMKDYSLNFSVTGGILTLCNFSTKIKNIDKTFKEIHTGK